MQQPPKPVFCKYCKKQIQWGPPIRQGQKAQPYNLDGSIHQKENGTCPQPVLAQQPQFQMQPPQPTVQPQFMQQPNLMQTVAAANGPYAQQPTAPPMPVQQQQQPAQQLMAPPFNGSPDDQLNFADELKNLVDEIHAVSAAINQTTVSWGKAILDELRTDGGAVSKILGYLMQVKALLPEGGEDLPGTVAPAETPAATTPDPLALPPKKTRAK